MPSYVAVTCTVPQRKIWIQATLMAIGFHIYTVFGPSWANLYISIFVGFLISLIGLNGIVSCSQDQYSQWLIQHFKRLREHQYWAAGQDEDNHYNIGQAIEVCKEMELQSLLSYPHEHSKRCARGCLLRHSDVFIIFGDHRAEPLAPRYARNVLEGKDIEFAGGLDEKAEDTDTDLYTGINTPRTDVEGKRDGDEDGGLLKDQKGDDSLDKSNEAREAAGGGTASEPEAQETSDSSLPKVKGPHPQKKNVKRKW
ncbi:hypothetical protein ONS95_000724 [Cadophora gregata]|uniref:uncharacterized protein n=1 Tax=Cadophora gregata TaxID=51156 RepID=UPI0026DCE5A3|nr:uncharacterized protein ONS95_000724 [Cadophora gregata]KAK0128773.1 hypothetical protein ONS95_000724 [Cadophora gregata]